MIYILLLLSVIAIILALYISFRSTKRKSKRLRMTGTPIFQDTEGRKPLAIDLNFGMRVWGLTAFGPQLLTVTDRKKNHAILENDSIIVNSFLDDHYFHEDFDIPSHAWRVAIVENKEINEFSAIDAKSENKKWIREESVWGKDDDFLSWDVMYEFMFEGFKEPFDFYVGYEIERK